MAFPIDHLPGQWRPVVEAAERCVHANPAIGLERDFGGRVLALWGLAFKANTDDMREAASLEIIRELTAAGMAVKAFDPVAGSRARSLIGDHPRVQICESQYEPLEGADALAIVTDWNQFRNPDFGRVRRLLSAPIIFDGRNLYDPDAVAGMGFAYFSIGRAPARPALGAGIRPGKSL